MKRVLLGACLGAIIIAVAFVLWFAIANSRAVTETPRYSVIERDGSFEVRDYPPLKLVTTAMSPDDRGMNGAFGRLFRFISGANEAARDIPMTTPVIVEGRRDEKGAMSFIVPAAEENDPPAPRDSAVSLRTHAGGRFAVLRFAGGREASIEQRAITALRAEIAKRKFSTEGEPFFAYYDPPWTPTFLRRNEVMMRLVAH